eukprot:12933862-Prorocentrum_lima.AAC.1
MRGRPRRGGAARTFQVLVAAHQLRIRGRADTSMPVTSKHRRRPPGDQGGLQILEAPSGYLKT